MKFTLLALTLSSVVLAEPFRHGQGAVTHHHRDLVAHHNDSLIAAPESLEDFSFPHEEEEHVDLDERDFVDFSEIEERGLESRASKKKSSSGGCFPATHRAIPSKKATKAYLQKSWWCNEKTEYAFMGFSYDVGSCPSQNQLVKDFKKMRSSYKARYVRIYNACDAKGFDDHVVNAAAEAGLGVYALVWFGFDGSSQWKTRMANLIKTIKTNHKAPYVIRNVAVGSEPLNDGVLSVSQLAAQIKHVTSSLKAYGIPATISELNAALKNNHNAPAVFEAMGVVEGNVLPFLSNSATSGKNAWTRVQTDIEYFLKYGKGKHLRLTQTGWPSNKEVWKGTSRKAIATTGSEQQYYALLNSKCSYFKKHSIGWFAHIYEDDSLPGWGILKNGKAKFKFSPKTKC